MATVRIEFSTDNQAFEGHGYGEECRRILTSLANRFSDAGIGLEAAGRLDGLSLRDSNGNTVGRVEVTD